MTPLEPSNGHGAADVVRPVAAIPPPRAGPASLHVEECDAIFGREWVCVGHVAMLPRVGDYFTIDLIGNLLVAVRAADRLRVLSRVCLHRWASVVEGAGNLRRFTCPFHAWSYALDGRLLAAAFMERAEGFEREQCRLPEVRSEIVDQTGLIFINLSQTSAASADLPQALFEAGLNDAAAAGPFSEERVDSDWKEIIADASGAGSGVAVVLPNLLVKVVDDAAKLQFVYPDGPGASIVRTIGILGTTGSAIMRDAPPPSVADYVRARM